MNQEQESMGCSFKRGTTELDPTFTVEELFKRVDALALQHAEVLEQFYKNIALVSAQAARRITVQ